MIARLMDMTSCILIFPMVHFQDLVSWRMAAMLRSTMAVCSLIAVTVLFSGSAWALGLGRLNVQSALGETLRAEIDITSLTAEEDSTLRVRIASPDSCASMVSEPFMGIVCGAGRSASPQC